MLFAIKFSLLESYNTKILWLILCISILLKILRMAGALKVLELLKFMVGSA